MTLSLHLVLVRIVQKPGTVTLVPGFCINCDAVSRVAFYLVKYKLRH